MEVAKRDGPEAASAATGVPPGTVRSWLAREKRKRERDAVDLSGLEQIKAIGMAIVRARERRSPEERAEDERRAEEERLRKIAAIEGLSRGEPVEESKPKKKRRRGRRGRRAERKRTTSGDSQSGGYAVNAPDQEPMRVMFDSGPVDVERDSVQSQIGGRFPKRGGRA